MGRAGEERRREKERERELGRGREMEGRERSVCVWTTWSTRTKAEGIGGP